MYKFAALRIEHFIQAVFVSQMIPSFSVDWERLPCAA